MSKSILDLLNDELAKTRQDIQDAEKRESDILKAIKAIDEETYLISQPIREGDLVEVVSTELTDKRHDFIYGEMYDVGSRFVVGEFFEKSSFGTAFVHDENRMSYALEDLKLVKKGGS